MNFLSITRNVLRNSNILYYFDEGKNQEQAKDVILNQIEINSSDFWNYITIGNDENKEMTF